MVGQLQAVAWLVHGASVGAEWMHKLAGFLEEGEPGSFPHGNKGSGEPGKECNLAHCQARAQRHHSDDARQAWTRFQAHSK